MVVISTFVIFDIETTGLPRCEKNRTKITELTFLAVSVKDIEEANISQMPLINKLSYLFNPERNIQLEVTALTGLSNKALKNQLIFKNRISSINLFLNELPKPVCLVAHNGNSFDFKLLRSEYKDAGADLPDDLYCVDTLWGFKHILKDNNLCHERIAANTSKSDADLLTDDEDWPELNMSAEDCDEIDQLVESFSKISPLKNSDNSKTTGKDKSVPTKANKPVLKISNEKGPKIIFTLQALYKRLLNKVAVNAHRSEADCIMLLECIIALKEKFLPYMYDKCKLISEVKPYERY
ncbi:uncharacterized protein [Epargyreus clarus]|uniref:uncharacterized protein n=1 Tax=Epargyreus clarus TaxID=520877 RepID=UPI003C2FBE73